MKAETLKIRRGLVYVFPEVALLGTGKHYPTESAMQILKILLHNLPIRSLQQKV